MVRRGETGFVAKDVQQFARCILDVAGRQDLLRSMRISARNYAIATSWDQVFEAVYAGYERGLKNCGATGKRTRPRARSAVCAGGV